MFTLGICNDETASACLFNGGKLMAAVSEERFSRKKMDNSFPEESIKYVLNQSNIQLNQVHTVAYAWAKDFDSSLKKKFEERLALASLESDESLEIFLEREKWSKNKDSKKREEFDEWINKNIDLSKTKVINYYHHEAHASSAALMSPFNEGVVLTADGRGDSESSTIWYFNRNKRRCLRKIYSSFSCDSLGYFYGRITGLLGFTPMRHEGKVTGLAAYGDPFKALPIMQKMINVNEGRLVGILGEYYRPFFKPYSDLLVNELASFSREDIAAAAQYHLERCLFDLLEFHLRWNNIEHTNLMLAGGVFGNVKATYVLKNNKRIDNVFVQPQMGDGGLCVGAASLSAHEDGNTISPLDNLFLGPSIEEESLEFISKKDFIVKAYKNIKESLCEDLADGRVVGLARGRMEFGPRALCHRSIIYKTSDDTINDWLNKRMKRTEFMPFAPVIRHEVAQLAFINYSENDITLKYMTSTIDCTEDFIKASPSVVHVDKTARPQIVKKEDDPFMWEILYLWEKKSNEMALVNTSLNAHEEPIICNVQDCLRSLKNKMIDVLYIGKTRIVLK